MVLVAYVLARYKCCCIESHRASKGGQVTTIERRNSLYEALAWSALFLWSGIATLVQGLPAGAGLFGIGAILVIVNVARHVSGIPVNGFSAILGTIATVAGTTVFVLRQGFGLPLPDLPFFPTLFVGIGIVILAYTAAHWRQSSRARNAHEQPE
jgi:hypothetical protein